MAVSLTKGGNVSLSKESNGCKRYKLVVGWKERATDGDEFDLDLNMFMLNQADRVPTDDEFVFYGQPDSKCGSVQYLGDNRRGGTEEAIIDTESLPEKIKKVAVTVTIDEAEARRQNFGQVADAYIEVRNADTDEVIVRHDLSEDSGTETAMIFAELYRHNNEFKFRAISQGFKGGLRPLAMNYGVNVE